MKKEHGRSAAGAASGCQPSASAAEEASSQSGIPNAEDLAFERPLPPTWALDFAAKRAGFADWFAVPTFFRDAVNRRVIVDARLLALHSLSAWPERRPQCTEAQLRQTAEYFASHLPNASGHPVVEDADLNAMRAAFIRRFGEQLPRTETLMAVAHVGYRMALRDIASGIETEGHDGATRHGAEHESPAPQGDAQC